MDWVDFLTAFGLMLIFEGLLPFINPTRWKHLLSSIETMSEAQLRISGLVVMLGGVLLIYIVRNLDSL